MTKFNCPKCGGFQYPNMDKKYLLDSKERDEDEAQCWKCDHYAWRFGEITIEEFERREREASIGEK